MSDRRTVVGVDPAAALIEHQSLFAALQTAFAVRFVPLGPHAPQLDGAILVVAGANGFPADVPAVAFSVEPGSVMTTREVELEDRPAVDRRIRTVVLSGQFTGPPLQPAGEGDALAFSEEGPVWVRCRQSPNQDRISAPLPVLEDGATLLEALHGGHSLGLVAIIHFLRALDRESWARPGLRAAFVFDDPNLRRTRYGYLDYRQLVNHADEHGYHAAMAMVPLDTRHWSKKAVAIFRARPDRLSLVMHGNDHSSHELASSLDLPAALSLGAQALRRIARFELVAGLQVDRVMMPPHAAWSRIGARALGGLGYDAFCASHAHPSTEAGSKQGPLAGWGPATFVEGCAVVPRVPLGLGRTGLALRAFLGQPLVLYGHHDDLACGLDRLADAAALVNGLGDVRWCSVGELVHTNRELRTEDGIVAVRPWGQTQRVAIPPSADRLSVCEPLGGRAGSGLIGWSVLGAASGGPRRFGELAPVVGPEVVVRLHTAWEVDALTVASRPRDLSALARRRASELRDQLAPALPHSVVRLAGVGASFRAPGRSAPGSGGDASSS